MGRQNREPFGEASCEAELKALKDDYSKLYFEQTPFNSRAIATRTYLIVGRRGSGKTSLAQYFSFQTILKEPVYIDVDEPEVFQQVLSDIASQASELREIAIPRLKKIWEYVLWCIVFEHTREQSTVIAEACDETCRTGRVSHFINSMIDRLIKLFGPTDKSIETRMHQLLNDERFEAAKAEALKIAVKRPIIIAIDTLERSDLKNDSLMNAMAALVQCAADFNLDYRERNIHLKVFMSGEVFPHLEEVVIQNPLKSIKHPVYLFWRPKDLLRLISWRWFNYLRDNEILRNESKGEIRWDKYNQVLDKMWIPYFGESLTTARGFEEHTFSYVLRHTQMRPRQLVLLCNAITERSMKAGRFPICSQDDILDAIGAMEIKLANEIISSFETVYPNVSKIVDALIRMPMLFTGNELEKRARQSATHWPQSEYSPDSFSRLVAELGIVGLVRSNDEASRYIDADFEYSIEDRLPITHRDQCVIHPMFNSRLKVDFNVEKRVMPFSTAQDER